MNERGVRKDERERERLSAHRIGICSRRNYDVTLSSKIARGGSSGAECYPGWSAGDDGIVEV